MEFRCSNGGNVTVDDCSIVSLFPFSKQCSFLSQKRVRERDVLDCLVLLKPIQDWQAPPPSTSISAPPQICRSQDPKRRVKICPGSDFGATGECGMRLTALFGAGSLASLPLAISLHLASLKPSQPIAGLEIGCLLFCVAWIVPSPPFRNNFPGSQLTTVNDVVNPMAQWQCGQWGIALFSVVLWWRPTGIPASFLAEQTTENSIPLQKDESS